MNDYTYLFEQVHPGKIMIGALIAIPTLYAGISIHNRNKYYKLSKMSPDKAINQYGLKKYVKSLEVAAGVDTQDAIMKIEIRYTKDDHEQAVPKLSKNAAKKILSVYISKLSGLKKYHKTEEDSQIIDKAIVKLKKYVI